MDPAIICTLQQIDDALDAAKTAIEDGDLDDAESEINDAESHLQTLRIFLIEAEH